MNKLKMLLSATICLLTIGICCLIVSRFVNSATPKKNNEDLQEPTAFEDNSKVFCSLEEYEAYIISELSARNQEDSSCTEVHYFYPQNTVEGVTVKSVEITDEGTIFTYDVSGLITRDSVMSIGLADETLLELISIARVKLYNSSMFANNTEELTYLARLADAIEATPIGNSGYAYWGTVYVDIEQTNGTFVSTAIARQVASISLEGPNMVEYIKYTYTPFTVQSEISDRLFEMESRTVSVFDTTND